MESKATCRLAHLAKWLLILLLYCSSIQTVYAQMGYVNGILHYPGIQNYATFHVVGKGIEPERATTRAQAILMAERAAIVDGYRQLTEKIHGVYVDSQSYVSNGSLNYSIMQNETQAWLRGARIVKINHRGDGITEAEMTLSLYNGCHCRHCNTIRRYSNDCGHNNNVCRKNYCNKSRYKNSYYEERYSHEEHYSIKNRYY